MNVKTWLAETINSPSPFKIIVKLSLEDTETILAHRSCTKLRKEHEKMCKNEETYGASKLTLNIQAVMYIIREKVANERFRN